MGNASLKRKKNTENANMCSNGICLDTKDKNYVLKTVLIYFLNF